MTSRQAGVLVAAFLLAAVAGFRVSRAGGIQPGYFEKQEAPAYGVSKDTPMGSEFGKRYEEYFKKLYEEPSPSGGTLDPTPASEGGRTP